MFVRWEPIPGPLFDFTLAKLGNMKAFSRLSANPVPQVMRIYRIPRSIVDQCPLT